MSEARRRRRYALQHYDALGDILMGFYEFLEASPKPSDDEVRREFVSREQQWKRYCAAHRLNDKASSLFNQEVALSWHRRYARKDTTES